MPKKPQAAPDFIPADSTPDFIPADVSTPASARRSTPTATLTAAPAPNWFQDAESDVSNGGKRTILGRVLGKMQGSDDGYSGLGGVSEGVKNFMGSPVLGLLHAGESAETIPDHPVKGALGTIGGIAEAGTIPSMFMGGPGAKAAINAVPSKAYAGQIFSQLAEDAGNAGIKVDLNDALAPLRRLQDLGDTGHSLPKGVTQLSKNIRDLPYQKARDFSSTISNLTADERMAIRPEAGAELTKLSRGLHTDISDALSPITDGAERYAEALKEYAQASRISDFVKKAAGLGTKAGLTAAGGAGAYKGYNALRGLFK